MDPEVDSWVDYSQRKIFYSFSENYTYYTYYTLIILNIRI
jgi:hypothetical protein